MKTDKHKDHAKKRLYARNQSSGAKHWQATEFYVCECGALLEEVMYERKTWKKSA